ncbi:AAA domain-containing protein [Pholiota molesta]|nr:AAA domain-containing protein [Pholiota molesta]
MASLNKLAIRGIRSFDDKQIAIIEFFSPVTVIVGHNGSGKTTIIECLKYATTGDQPPNTRGGAFIHDPKMANEKEVRAQVKLRFHAANGTRMLAVRNLSVSVKKTGLTMKTLEGILSLADENAEKAGKRGTISTKCAEMDSEIPQLLGVSKAVLENVIFCHQEDSYWPLAEPSALKKKFDDIFEATRYTKALDSIKNLRKDRVAELKAEKERLLSLSREKAHADKLKDRINEFKSMLAAKEVECEDSKQQYDALAEQNRKFYDQFSRFREIYLVVEKLEEKKFSTKTHLADMKAKYRELPGSLEELESRSEQFEDSINIQKENKRLEERKLEDTEEELNSQIAQQRSLIVQKGRLLAEAEEQDRRIAQREQAIQEIASVYGLKGYDQTPLERDKVLEFLARLSELQRKQQVEYENLPSELKTKTDEYHAKLRALDSELEAHKSQKQRIRDQAERQDKIKKIERALEDMQSVPMSLRTLQVEMEDKKERLQKLKSAKLSAKYDERLAELANKGRKLEDERDQLNNELQSLSAQAEMRARLDMKRKEAKSKASEVQTSLDFVNAKLKKIARREADVGSLEDIVDQLLLEKEHEQSKLNAESKVTDSKLQKVSLELSTLKTQLAQKKRDLSDSETELKEGMKEHSEQAKTLEEAINLASLELDDRKNTKGTRAGTKSVYETLLKEGRETKKCGACTRHMNDRELAMFEKHMKETLAKTMAKSLADIQSELEEWAEELGKLQNLQPIQLNANQLKTKDIPALEEQIREKESIHPDITQAAEAVAEKLEIVNRDLKEIQSLKQLSININRLQRETEKAIQEVNQLEQSLSKTGSTKTAEDVNSELSRITSELRKNDRESKTVSNEVDRQSQLIRDLENDLHSMELEERDLLSKAKEKERYEQDIDRMTEEIGANAIRQKDIDRKISEAQAPIDSLQEAYQRVQRDLSLKISEAQRLYEELNKYTDRLNDMNKNVERYVKEKKSRALQECTSRLEGCDMQISEIQTRMEASREAISSISREINESGATISNLRDNIIVQKLTRDIATMQAEIDSYDMEGAAKARRNYEDKYEPAKRREDKLSEVYHQLTGELGSLKVQLKSLETDLKEFKDVYKNYTEQLIRVKVSDMANSDLEKYAKALDNAIMKYHGLKMEEVNDTMKHLWNKTYQGTDIDGIKIRSDVEGAASKRSYNYRVVMTKDQVEMDMRGRCSAGQKMLASIIIRLALSDSFGQNCGILALDEPTNALDTENMTPLQRVSWT